MYVGLTLVIVLPDLDFTNSLLMKRPRGWLYLTPLGAVSLMKRSDMVYLKSAIVLFDVGDAQKAAQVPDADLMPRTP